MIKDSKKYKLFAIIILLSLGCMPSQKRVIRVVRNYYLKGNNVNTIKYVTKYLKKYSNTIELYMYRGLAYINLSKYRLAEKDFKKVIKIAPKGYYGYWGIGYCWFIEEVEKHFLTGRIRTKIVRIIEKNYLKALSVVKKKKDRVKVFNDLGYLYMYVKRYKESEKVLKKALMVKQYGDTYFILGILYGRWLKNKDKWLTYLLKSLKCDFLDKRRRGELYFVLASYYGIEKIKNGKFSTYKEKIKYLEKGIKYVKKAIKINPHKKRYRRLYKWLKKEKYWQNKVKKLE